MQQQHQIQDKVQWLAMCKQDSFRVNSVANRRFSVGQSIS